MFKHSQLESVKAWLSQPEYTKYPLYLRIQRALRRLILDGVLQAGNSLPATRALAKSLNVSRDTVENAYSLLHAEGYIDRKTGSGSFVTEMPLWQKQASDNHPIKSAANALMPDDSMLSRRGKKMWATLGIRDVSVVRPFAPGVPETRMFPIALWERLERQVTKEYGFQSLQYNDPQGIKELRHAIARYVNLERGAHVSADRIVILTSSQQAITLCANVLLDEGDKIFTENPVYQGAHKAFQATGLICVAIPVDEQGIQVEVLKALPQHAKAVFLTPSHQYPSGTTLSLERRLALIEWAQQQQAWIIEDDYDSEFHYAGKPIACVQGLDAYNRTIYIGTFTKSLFPGLRIGYLILPPQLVKPMTAARTLQDGHNASIAQLTLARFIENGHFGAYIRQMRRVYAERLNILNQLIKIHLADYLIPFAPSGGMQMPCLLTDKLLNNKLLTDKLLSYDEIEKQIIDEAQKYDIKLIGLSGLYLEKPIKYGFLIGFAAYTPHEIDIALLKLKAIFNNIDKLLLINPS